MPKFRVILKRAYDMDEENAEVAQSEAWKREAAGWFPEWISAEVIPQEPS